MLLFGPHLSTGEGTGERWQTTRPFSRRGAMEVLGPQATKKLLISEWRLNSSYKINLHADQRRFFYCRRRELTASSKQILPPTLPHSPP